MEEKVCEKFDAQLGVWRTFDAQSGLWRMVYGKSQEYSMGNDTLAELVLLTKGVDVDDDIILVEKKGRFYRGYSPDLLEFKKYEKTTNSGEEYRVSLSRNGLMFFLPEGIFFEEDSFHKAKDSEELKRLAEELEKKRKDVSSFFMPFDMAFFKEEYRMAKVVAEMETKYAENMLEYIYGFDIKKESSKMVRDLALLRINSKRLKGNVRMLAFHAKAILKEQVDYEWSGKMISCSGKSVMCRVLRFFVLIENLDEKQYVQKMEEYKEFFKCLFEWFIPFDVEAEYGIKDFKQVFEFGSEKNTNSRPMILGYNTQL